MARTFIQPEGHAKPAVPLAHGVRKGNILQVAGQVAFNSAGEVVGTTVAEQTRQVLDNVKAVLEAGGATLGDVVMYRVYLTDVAHFGELNEAYSAYLGTDFPARTTVYVGLPPGLLVEIDALAVVD
ncbi:reactive intermediate/imine deaminase [Kibdelosporangium banguiense]|uniref:Reactive intermediate/imine deaminase n=1 Tax=Kibdelosporangium banguiense TaxID=1365924 RepID=A0ABS4TKY8_9PSEU|nr:RidA family protein [Kibdelosporangium banguiense]MBP2324635.1 reactive intermediate/imine deaminase [Kibdelosporangium banguiense]